MKTYNKCLVNGYKSVVSKHVLKVNSESLNSVAHGVSCNYSRQIFKEHRDDSVLLLLFPQLFIWVRRSWRILTLPLNRWRPCGLFSGVGTSRNRHVIILFFVVKIIVVLSSGSFLRLSRNVSAGLIAWNWILGSTTSMVKVGLMSLILIDFFNYWNSFPSFRNV